MAGCACASQVGANHEKRFQKVCEILDYYERNPRLLVPILQQVQEVYHYLPSEILEFVATSLGVPTAHVFGVATFYAHFSLEPKGKHHIKICDGTACHVKGSTAILEAIREKLNLSGSAKTTDDMLFTVETVSCLGACGLAPAVVVDEQVHGNVTPAQALSLIENLTEGKEENQ
ncbi:MAG: NAD(P)H-dependent oxidoreductase subunit E [Candidatus Sumerlaeaceae bacterium]|nr:NAD(P)H-dependent oxidoreductase subunit E [Candidatus Sumerlaeaceae bacterium]